MTERAPLLALDGVSVRFGVQVALDNASLVVRPGSVHAVLGENGAGKTTMMRVAFGLLAPDRGRVLVNGAAVRFASPRAAIAAGIGMVHQHFSLVPAMTVAENLVLGGRGRYSSSAAAEQVRRIASRTGFALDPGAMVDALPVGAQQRVEIAKALARAARVLVLDEPTAVLAPAEADELLRWLRRFADDGNAVVLVTHKLHEALAIADDVTVLRRGRVVLAAGGHDVSLAALTAAMLGDAGARLAELPLASPSSLGSPMFAAHDAGIANEAGRMRIRHASFTVHSGELVGVAGIEGAGQRELLRALAGRLPIASGRLDRPDRVGFIPEDRHRDGTLLRRSLTENIALRGAGTRRGLTPWRALRSTTGELVRSFDVRGGDADDPMACLSGGNQQKLVAARELTDVQAIVAENPTHGLDVRATREIHDRLRAACGAGAAVVLYSSDLDEVVGLASRVLVVHDGVVHDAPADREIAGRAMLGAR